MSSAGPRSFARSTSSRPLRARPRDERLRVVPSLVEGRPISGQAPVTPTRPRAVLCLVTDRRRLAKTRGRPAAEWRSLVLEQIEGAVAGGVDLVQIRERDLEGGALVALVRDVLKITSHTGTRVVVNDRADVAISAGAHGVHLREGSIRAAAVRRLAAGLLVGRSVHGRTGVATAGADYLIAGSVFASGSKDHDRLLLGVDGLADIVHEAATTPVLAIGGVTEATMERVVRAGAAGVAAIGAFIPPGQLDDLSRTVEKTAKNLRFAFDSASPVS